LDPFQNKYPGESPYNFVSDNPIFYADMDGRDKIITITFIGTDGRRSMIQVKDKNYFLYTKEATYNGPKYYKYDVKQELTINLQSKTSSFTSERVYSSFKEITWFEHSKLQDALSWIQRQTPTGDNSDKQQVGWRLYGLGTDMEWQNGLPRPAEGSDMEGIDISTLLELTSSVGPNSSPSELYTDIVTKWSKHAGKDMKQVLTGLEVMVDQIDNFTEVTKSLLDLVENSKKLVAEIKRKTNTSGDHSLKPESKKITSVYCRFHKTNFVTVNGVVSNKSSTEPARDTVDAHGESVKSKHK